MNKVIVFGNSASGKSTLSKKLSLIHKLAHLDLDTLAWQEGTDMPKRRSLAESKVLLDTFMDEHEKWIIEGCYSDLFDLILDQAEEAFYLDLPLSQCIENARKRPWEPHKYESKQAQDENLNMLIDWISDYEIRTDCFSKKAHMALFEQFNGAKTQLKEI